MLTILKAKDRDSGGGFKWNNLEILQLDPNDYTIFELAANDSCETRHWSFLKRIAFNCLKISWLN